jgi:hypothetical protein
MNGRGNLFCINAADGQTAWSDTGRRGSYGGLVDAGAALFILTERADLVVYKPLTTGFEQLATYKVSEENVYAFPVVSGNRIFVKSGDALTLYTL